MLQTSGAVLHFADAESAAAALTEGRLSADVIVIAQAYAGEFSAAAVNQWRRLAPLARVVALLGSWCEGEMRTGRPWPGAIRVYWHQWPAQCGRELGRLASGQPSSWALPPTASDEERLLAAAEQPLPRRQGLIAIHTLRSEIEGWLSAACRACGYSTVWLRPPRPARVQGASAAIFDGSDGRREELDELKRLVAAMTPAPIIALLDFPRIEDGDRLLAAGVAAVLSKPVQVPDLLWELDRITAEAVLPRTNRTQD